MRSIDQTQPDFQVILARTEGGVSRNTEKSEELCLCYYIVYEYKLDGGNNVLDTETASASLIVQSSSYTVIVLCPKFP